MQRNSIQIKKQVVRGFFGILWVCGLLVAGSDSAYMPWINLIGLLVFLGASLYLGTCVEGCTRQNARIIRADFTKKQRPGFTTDNKHPQNRRCHSRYALSA